MSKLFSVGGYVAAAVLIVLGLGLAIAGFVGSSYVNNALADEQIVGTPDMTPDAISAAIKEAGLTGVSAPSCTVAGEKVDTGMEAKCFADYMRIHALEATGGKTYSQMPQYATDDGKGTNDKAAASKGPNGAPVSNAARQIWVTETALTTALNVSLLRRGSRPARDRRRDRVAARRRRLPGPDLRRQPPRRRARARRRPSPPDPAVDPHQAPRGERPLAPRWLATRTSRPPADTLG